MHYHTMDDNTNQDIAFDELLEIHNNKININNTTETELSVIPFLSTSQIRDIIYYITVNGAMFSLGELQFIPSIDYESRRFMHLFCYAGESPKNKLTTKDLISNANNELVARTDLPLYVREGYGNHSGTGKGNYSNQEYDGSRLYHSFRYRMSSMDHLSVGIQAEKDAGEKGIDYISGYAMIQDIGKIKNAIIGDYKISFGEGLVVNTGYGFGKAMSSNQTEKLGRGISRHSSCSESNYFTGGAMTYKTADVLLTGYASYRKGDGTYNNDSTGITSLKTDGMHRTSLEKSKKGNIGITDLGGNIQWSKDNFQLSASFAYTHYSMDLMPKYNTKASLYRYFNAHGKDFFSYGIAYAYRGRKWNFTGETASCNTGGIATINSLRWNINSNNNITAIQRYYSYRYNSINSNSFSENSMPKNEQGIYIGWNGAPIKKMTISSYIDIMYFPWMKYQVSNSSYGFDWMVQACYSPTKKLDLSIRYKAKCKQKDFVISKTKKDTIKVLQYNCNHNMRISCNYKATEKLSLKTTISGTFIDFGPSTPEFGYAIGELVQWENTDKKMRFNISATYFCTDSYNSRIFGYESSLLYSFGMTSYYYKGIITYALCSFPIIKDIILTGKVGMTHYLNKETIGTGLELINTNHKEDIQLQIRWKF